MDNLKFIVEALVFAAGRVVSPDEIREGVATITGQTGPTDDEIGAAVTDLNDVYSESGRAFRIHAWAGGFRMATVAEAAPYVQTLFEESPRRMTRSLMETLSIVAYRQPITKPEIDNIRGVDSNYGLRKLMELGFVAMTGRSDTVGRPLLFGTTSRFLEEFGLLSLDELPKLREAEELFQDDQLLALRSEIESDDEQEESKAGTNGPEDTADSGSEADREGDSQGGSETGSEDETGTKVETETDTDTDALGETGDAGRSNPG